MGEIKTYTGKPWDRQVADGELEPMRWFSRFDRYFRPQGPERSMLAAYNAWREDEGKEEACSTPDHWWHAAERYDWRYRAEAWDEHNRRLRLSKEEEERRKMQERHIKLATGLQVLGGTRMSQLRQQPDMLSPAEARRYIKEGISIERRARGLPEYLLAVAQMTDDELLSRYNQLLEGAGGLQGGNTTPWLEAPDPDESVIS